jgi:acyl-CoA thioester hydrolase
MDNPDFTLEMSVRDYECDYGSIVNNANYLNYLEHTRSQYAISKGFNPVQLAKTGVVMVVAHIDIKYIGSLVAGDSFIIETKTSLKGSLRLVFEQEIWRIDTSKSLVTKAITTLACITSGVVGPFPPELLSALMNSGECL